MSPYYQPYSRGPGVPFGFHVTWTRTVKWLMGACTGVLVLQLLLEREGLGSLSAPFVMTPGQVFAFPPRLWQLVTYMFLHAGVRHFFWNMVPLFFFAGDVERELGTKRFLRLYFACGVSGALLSCLVRPEYSLVGASAGVLGVLVAFAILYPHAIVYLIVLPIRARYLAIGLAILTVLWAMEQDPGSRVSHWGHLGGMTYAFVALWVLPRMGWRVGLASWLSVPSWLSLSRWRDRRREGQRLRQARRQAEVQEELDRILAKVHQQGLSSLTESERRFLKRVSKRYRDG